MNLLLTALLIVFLIHLVVFTVLGVKRKQGYYLALVVTFSLLSASVMIRLLAPELSFGDQPVSQLLRYLAWGAAAVSISWTLTRLIRKRRSA